MKKSFLEHDLTCNRPDTDGVKELCVRTCLARGVKVAEYTDLSPEDLAHLASSEVPDSARKLAELFDLFASEYAYQPTDAVHVLYGQFAVELARSKQCGYVLHSHGAIQSLDGLLGLLDTNGFILVNDYGSVDAKDYENGFEHQRFGGSVAVGVNFAILEEYFRQRGGCQWVAPPEDNGHIYSRMMGININLDSTVVKQFQSIFSKSQFEWKREPANAANACIGDGRLDAAAVAYREALQRQPYNWLLMSEAARFLMFTLKDARAGLQLARAALLLTHVRQNSGTR